MSMNPFDGLTPEALAVRAAMADAEYIEDAIARVVLDYRKAAFRYLDECPEAAPGDVKAEFDRLIAAVEAGYKAAGICH